MAHLPLTRPSRFAYLRRVSMCVYVCVCVCMSHTGAEFDALSGLGQSQAVSHLAVLSRVEPLHKLKLVELLQAQVRCLGHTQHTRTHTRTHILQLHIGLQTKTHTHAHGYTHSPIHSALVFMQHHVAIPSLVCVCVCVYVCMCVCHAGSRRCHDR